MTSDLLDIDVRLLVFRYGRTKVLQALARTGEQQFEDLEREIRALAERKAANAKRTSPSIMDLVAGEAQKNPLYAEPLRALAVGFENRTFLPHLRDVQRFLYRNDTKHGKLKSRAAAAPLVIRALAKLSLDELARLRATEVTGDESDYALLARAIMKTPSSKPPDATPEK